MPFGKPLKEAPVKDSFLKRVLLILYFNYHELREYLQSIFCRQKQILEKMDYDGYWQQRSPMGLHARHLIIARQIEAGDSVLDVGCGDGYFLSYLKGLKAVKELGIDVSSVAIKKALAKGINARVEPFLDFAKNDRHDLFDYIIMSEVLEHLVDAEDYIKLGFKLARKALIISFPNSAYWPFRLRLLFGRFPVQWAYHPCEHLRFWSVTDFKDWIKSQGLQDAKYKVYFYPSNGITIFNLHKMLANLFCRQMVVVIKKSFQNAH